MSRSTATDRELALSLVREKLAEVYELAETYREWAPAKLYADLLMVRANIEMASGPLPKLMIEGALKRIAEVRVWMDNHADAEDRHTDNGPVSDVPNNAARAVRLLDQVAEQLRRLV